VSICQTSILCSKSVVVILPSLSEYTEVQFKLKTKTKIFLPFISNCISAGLTIVIAYI